MPTQPMPPPTEDGLPAPQRYLAVATLLLALVLVVLDIAIANVALPTIAASYNASAADTVWVVTSYQLAVLIVLLPCGALGEAFGPRRTFLAGVTIFTLGSAACACAGSLTLLIVARFVQGIGGGAIMALVTMNLRFVVPRHQLGTVIGFNAMTIAISAAAGPGLAGAILSIASWPWLFAVNLPIGVAVFVCGGLLRRVEGAKRLPAAPVLLVNTLVFVLFFAGAERVASAPASGAALIAGAAACLVVLLRLQRGSAAPLVPTDLLALPAFRVAVIASVACFAGQMLSYVALPFYLQHALAMPPARAGLYMMPWPAAVVVMAPLAGQLANRVKTAWLCALGGGLMTVGLLIVGLGPVDAGTFLVGTVIAGIGFGLFQTPNNRTLLLSAPRARSGAAGAMQGTARLLGQTCGAIAMSLIFAATAPAAANVAPNAALVVAALLTAAASLISLGRVRYETVG